MKWGRLPTFRLSGFPTCRFVGFPTYREVGGASRRRWVVRCWVWSPAGGAASGWGVGAGDCIVQLLHCAITIIGGWQPARCWWCARQLSNFPTCQLSNFPASRLVGLLVCWRWWGLRVCGYSEALMRISERGASGLLNESLPPRRGGGRKGVAVSSCFCYTTRLNESLPGLPAKVGTGRNRGLGEEFTVC